MTPSPIVVIFFDKFYNIFIPFGKLQNSDSFVVIGFEISIIKSNSQDGTLVKMKMGVASLSRHLKSVVPHTLRNYTPLIIFS